MKLFGQEIKIEDPKNFILVTTTIGFFLTFGLLVFRKVPEGAPHDLLLMAFTGIVSKWGTIVDFFFGSSSGPFKKNPEVIEEDKK